MGVVRLWFWVQARFGVYIGVHIRAAVGLGVGVGVGFRLDIVLG